jgi:hypothetical protein
MPQSLDFPELLAALLKLVERFKFQWLTILSASRPYP